MITESELRLRGERGAALILAIAFLVVIGVVGGAVLSAVSSGINARSGLDQARNRQYAADAAIDSTIALVRQRMSSGNALAPCIGNTVTLNGVQIAVACNYVPTVTAGYHFLQRNVALTATCASAQGPKCPTTAAVIIRAQVNFASPAIATDPSISVTRTYVQSWSVNT
jgi:type II secretory pathway component PulK